MPIRFASTTAAALPVRTRRCSLRLPGLSFQARWREMAEYASRKARTCGLETRAKRGCRLTRLAMCKCSAPCLDTILRLTASALPSLERDSAVLTALLLQEATFREAPGLLTTGTTERTGFMVKAETEEEAAGGSMVVGRTSTEAFRPAMALTP